MKKLILIAVAIVVFSGCAELKPIIDPSIKTIAVPTFTNSSSQYSIDTDMTTAVNSQFLIDGRLQIAPKEKADVLLEGNISSYVLEPIAYDFNNNIISYRIKIVVNIKYTNLKTGKVEWEQKEVGGPFGGTATYNVIGKNVETEAAARQRIYKDLADAIVNRVIYGWGAENN
jgi:hypothetical protein